MGKPGPRMALSDAASGVPKQVDEYEIIRPLGSGAMGQVYQAVDTVLGRPVAVKILASASPSESARERFLIEARAIARLQHPNVLSIYRVGLVAGRPYLASEFVRGQSLDKLALPLPFAQTLDIAVQLARGLAEAHRQGVLHRDLKPANAMLTEDGTAKLLDFGLAKLSDDLCGHDDMPSQKSLLPVSLATPAASAALLQSSVNNALAISATLAAPVAIMSETVPGSEDEYAATVAAPAAITAKIAPGSGDEYSASLSADSSAVTAPLRQTDRKSMTVTGSLMGTVKKVSARRRRALQIPDSSGWADIA